MTWWLSSFVIVLVVGAIAAARVMIGKAQAVARDEYEFARAPIVDHEPIVSELRRGGAI
ncbi:hypothetical protein PZ895_07885 [Mesorhizobium sp. YIM 152430]|uniref:hypothetical protein n=1 Tax=Mesorhizobium sp. YIM 152430 TaxID=3031761 RepID=UPI0023DA39B4|nr:hypothetical protein [Mesorhizobium sp. YIM 152430]MDF1599695.1 hypothetical protein [Mesorhizobium sp. YIM 152430]